MKLSIVIPVYNVEPYLRHCLESCVYQDLPTNDYEIIVVNDGSPDNSAVIINEFKNRYSHIVVLEKENGGLSSARNAGLQIARGDYVWFVDADDYIDEGALLKVVKAINASSSDIICVDAIIENHKGKEITRRDKPRKIQNPGRYSSKEIFLKGFFYPYSGAQYYIVKTSFLKRNNIIFLEGCLYEDVLYTPTILSRSDSCFYLKDNLYVYIEREGSITGSSMSLKKNFQLLHIIDGLYNEYKNCETKKGRYILRESILKTMSTYYHYYYSALTNKEDQRKAREVFLDKTYILHFALRTMNIKAIIRWGQMYFNI